MAPDAARCNAPGPWAYLLIGTSASGQAFNRLHGRGTVVRRIRGHHCRTQQALLAEWARAFAFPASFGHNWDAFRDGLTGLDWLPARCYIAIVSDTGDVLPHDDAAFATFIAVLEATAAHWATPRPGPGGRPSLAFRVLFHTIAEHEGRVRARLQHAGVDPVPLRDALDSS